MRARMVGPVVAVEDMDPFKRRNGVEVRQCRVFIGSSNPRYAADSFECPEDLRPEVGELLDVPVLIDPRLFVRDGDTRSFLSVKLDESGFLAERKAVAEAVFGSADADAAQLEPANV